MEEKQDVFMISKRLHTNYLLITCGKTVILQWRNLMDTTLPKWPKSMSPAMGQANSMRRRAQHHLDISIKNSGSSLIVRNVSQIQMEKCSGLEFWKWTGEHTQRLGNVPPSAGNALPGVVRALSLSWAGPSSFITAGAEVARGARDAHFCFAYAGECVVLV